ncbi:N-acetylmuramoyl-L-alanine amidase [Parasulfitobacter algicola]|uniref:N-acetylmuramoyl-L-alanine amidase n=1 Tax=Parasulfitobacter algicola TaxID=2614809 RepID=A0ABX2IXI4_9RHOB|nr:N-acetylmuramoyl-L-alanine amidase [Sulfitobacter algicola]NSX55777.1 N-acetylmuramoyl-L-alanine amidase [Sulfitobacter algicola]
MKHILQVITLILLGFVPAQADVQSDQVYLNVAKSGIRDANGGIHVDLYLTHGTVHRVFTQSDPYRIIIDFQRVNWLGVNSTTLLNSDQVTNVHFGWLKDGWSRMIIDLAAPMQIETAGIQMPQNQGFAQFQLHATPTDKDTFVANLPKDTTALQLGQLLQRTVDNDDITIVLDPGHGGIDPGAQMGQVVEADIILQFAHELRQALENAGDFNVVLTREDDVFVPLAARISAAHNANADVFISLHADSVAESNVMGSTVYTLAEAASDTASAKLAERHDRADLIADVDLSIHDDQIAKVLMDIARLETDPRSHQLAAALVDGLSTYAGPINSRPHRQADFSVLKAADIPSVLIELGFMSNAQDLENITNPEWRAKAASGIVDAIVVWTHADATRARLTRK